MVEKTEEQKAAEEQRKKTKRELKNYEPATIAQKYTKEGKFEDANSALRNMYLSDDVKLLFDYDKYHSTPEGIKNASDAYGKRFNQLLLEESMGQLFDFYKPNIKYYSEEDQKKVKEVFEEHKDKILKAITQEFVEAKTIVDNPEAFKKNIEEYYSGEDLDKEVEARVEKAKKTLEKYQKVLFIQEKLQTKRMNGLENKLFDTDIVKLAKLEETEETALAKAA